MPFDFKKYHVKAMNARTDEEKVSINKELKELYNTLPEEEKEGFNKELQSFLIGEMGKIKSVYDGAKDKKED